MSRHLLIFASVAFVLVCSVSSLGQGADNRKGGMPENRKTLYEARGKSGQDEVDARKSKRKVSLQVIIRPSGKAEVIKVLEVTPGDLPKEVADEMVKTSIEAVKKLRFESPMKDGRPASQHALIEYYFESEEKANEHK